MAHGGHRHGVDVRLAALRALAGGKMITPTDVAKSPGVSRPSASQALRALVRVRLAKQIMRGRFEAVSREAIDNAIEVHLAYIKLFTVSDD